MDTESLAQILAFLPGASSLPPEPLVAHRVARHRPGPVVWRDEGDEVLLHLDRLRVRFLDAALSVGLELETDQTGRQPVQILLYLGDRPERLVLATEELPRGDELLVGRWGRALQGALVAGLVRLAEEAAASQPRHVPALLLRGERLVLSVPGAEP